MEVEVRCFCAVAAETPTISTTPAYQTGDAVGGLQTIGNAVRTPGVVSAAETTTTIAGTCVLQSISVIETGNQKAALGIVIFNGNPTASTFTDNTALAIAAGDIAKVIAYIPIAVADYVTVSTVSIATKSLGFVLPAGTDLVNLYAGVVTTGAPTYTATNGLRFLYGFLQN